MHERFKTITFDSDGSIFEGEPTEAREAAEMMAAEHFLHLLAGWSVERCSCGMGFTASRNGLKRSVHLECVEDDILSIALALGVIHPASIKDRLEVEV